MTDDELVAQAQRGNRAAWEQLWDRYGLEAQRWAFAVTGDVVDAEDVCQDAFAQALERLHTLRDPSRFGGWLRQIVRFKAVDVIRSRQRTTQIDLLERTAGSHGAVETYGSYTRSQPDAVFDREQQLLALRTALSRLPRQYRDVVRLFYFENRSQESIAKLLETTVPAVKGLLFRARCLLREEMNDE